MKIKTKTRLHRTLPIAVALLALPLAGALAQAAQPATVVYVVRHAERAEDGTNDPPISEAGEARARLLVH